VSNRSCLWRAAASDALAWREWDDELVVYNELTGNTHHLNAFGSIVLLTLVANPAGLDIATLMHAIEARVELEPGTSLEAENALMQLAALQLVERFAA
jgi:PqqD family protein of HPr-rel-A system